MQMRNMMERLYDGHITADMDIHCAHFFDEKNRADETIKKLKEKETKFITELSDLLETSSNLTAAQKTLKLNSLQKVLIKELGERAYHKFHDSFFMNDSTSVYRLHDMPLAALCAAVTGMIDAATDDKIQRKVLINPKFKDKDNENPTATTPNHKKSHGNLIEIHVDNDMEKEWITIFSSLPLVVVITHVDFEKKPLPAMPRR